MPLQCGIVGLPNAGKSTLFSALTQSRVQTDSYPFTTIDPNVGMVSVPDERLKKLSDILNSKKIIPTTLRIVDIAGLIKGSHQGEGLGNQFLAKIREVDAILHLVRCFESGQVSHPSGELDPERDIDIVETELILKDLETVTSRQESLKKKAQSGDKEAAAEMDILNEAAKTLDNGKPARNLNLTEDENHYLKELFLISSKPVLYAGNISESEATSHEDGPVTGSLKRWCKDQNDEVIIVSAALENELAFLSDEEERQFFMAEWGLNKTGLETLIPAAYRLLNLITFFTTESNMVQAWTVERETVAHKAAGVIHTDFEKGFIKADAYSCDDLFRHGSEEALRDEGLIHTHGKDYFIQDGDVVKFKFRT